MASPKAARVDRVTDDQTENSRPSGFGSQW
jgi:hypothetical protein